MLTIINFFLIVAIFLFIETNLGIKKIAFSLYGCIVQQAVQQSVFMYNRLVFLIKNNHICINEYKTIEL